MAREGCQEKDGGSSSLLSDFTTRILLLYCVVGVAEDDKGRVSIGLGLASIDLRERDG